MFQQNETDNINFVANRFKEMESFPHWTDVDDGLLNLDYLNDKELVLEAKLLSNKHHAGNPRCPVEHKTTECVVPVIIKAVDCIIRESAKKKALSPDHKLILQYYLALDFAGEILS